MTLVVVLWGVSPWQPPSPGEQCCCSSFPLFVVLFVAFVLYRGCTAVEHTETRSGGVNQNYHPPPPSLRRWGRPKIDLKITWILKLLCRQLKNFVLVSGEVFGREGEQSLDPFWHYPRQSRALYILFWGERHFAQLTNSPWNIPVSYLEPTLTPRSAACLIPTNCPLCESWKGLSRGWILVGIGPNPSFSSSAKVLSVPLSHLPIYKY